MPSKWIIALFLTINTFSFGLRGEEHREKGHVHRAAEFEGNPNLEAHSQDVILLDNQLPAPENRKPEFHFRIDRGKHTFCLKGGDPYFAGMILRNERGRVIFESSRTQECRSANLDAGRYTLLVKHLNSIPDPNKISLLDADINGPPLHDGNGNAVGGYWAISTLNAGNPQGPLEPQPPARNIGGIYTNDMPLITGPYSDNWNETSLISFPAQKHPTPLGPPGFFWDMTYLVVPAETYVMVSGDHDCTQRPYTCDFFSVAPYSYHLGLDIKDLGNWQFNMSWAGSPQLQATTVSTPFFQRTIQMSNLQAQNFWLRFRYYPDSSQIAPLNQGEVAFFEKCNYQGQGIVASNSFDPTSYSINGSSNNQFFSFRLSNNTLVQLSTIASPGGIPSQTATYVNDGSCLPAQLFDSNLIYPIDQMIDGRGNEQLNCPKCRLQGAILSNFNMQNSDWHQADMTQAKIFGAQFTAGTNLSQAKFINAGMSDVSFAGASLDGADFTGAELICVDLSGTSQNLRDLTGMTFTGVQWLPAPSTLNCSHNLSYTKLTTKILPPAVWKYADLTGAVFTDLTPDMVLSSQANPLDLTGAKLARVDLHQTLLDYAVMPSAVLNGTDLHQTSLRHVNLNNAKLYGTNLINTNLDGANLSNAYLDTLPGVGAAKLTGAFLRNVNLSGAQLSSADFTYASFFSTNAVGLGTCAVVAGFTQQCATAAGATLNNTQFSQTFLFGVDFTGATIQGVQFPGAVLIGANFNAAKLTGDPAIGINSGFPGAFLQGTNLASTKQLLNISLLNAYLDFSSQGNAFTMQLSGDHTLFPGAKNRGLPICVQPAYLSGTAVPTNNGTLTCPDSSQPRSGCGAMQASNTAWESQVDISAVGTYQFDATYTPAAAQQFCQPDNSWFTGGLSSARK